MPFFFFPQIGKDQVQLNYAEKKYKSQGYGIADHGYDDSNIPEQSHAYLKMVVMILYPAKNVPLTVPETLDTPIRRR